MWALFAPPGYYQDPEPRANRVKDNRMIFYMNIPVTMTAHDKILPILTNVITTLSSFAPFTLLSRVKENVFKFLNKCPRG